MTTKEDAKKATDIVAKMVDAGIRNSGKTATQIAKECHFNNACFISLIRKGNSRVPISKIGDLARAIGFDVVTFRNRVVQEYMPELWELDMREGILPLGLSLAEQKAVRIMKLELDKRNIAPDTQFYEGLRQLVLELQERSDAENEPEEA